MSDQPPIERPWDASTPAPKEPVSKRAKIIVGSVIALLVVAVGAYSLTSVSEGGKSPQSTEAQSPASQSRETGDAQFLTSIGTAFAGTSDSDMIALGLNVCDVFAEGNKGATVLALMLSKGLSNDQTVRLVYGAVTAYCPQYESLSQR